MNELIIKIGGVAYGLLENIKELFNLLGIIIVLWFYIYIKILSVKDTERCS